MKRVLCVLCLLPLALAAGCSDDSVTKPEPIPPATVKAECEDKTAEQNLGASGIHLMTHNAASGYEAVEGLDRVGEWIEIPVVFPRAGTYNMAFRHASVYDVGVAISLRNPERKTDEVAWTVALNPGTCGT